MKTLCTIAFIAVADALLMLAALLLVAGYQWWATALGVATLAAVALAAWLGRSKPAPVPAPVREWLAEDLPLPDELSPVEEQMLRFGQIDPVDLRAAQWAATLNAPTLPQLPLILPGHRADLCDTRQEKRYYDGLGDQ